MNSEEIAKLANVSRSTVSRVINNYPNVTEETRIKVQKIIDQYGYVPNNPARMLSGKTNDIIGVFIAELENDNPLKSVRSEQNQKMLIEIIEKSKREGFLVLVNVIKTLDECRDIEALFVNRMIYGGIFIGFPYRNPQVDDIADKDYNIVFVDQYTRKDDYETIYQKIDRRDSLGGFKATSYLVKKGHKDILILTGDASLSSKERARGYVEAMETNGLTPEIAKGELCPELAKHKTLKAFSRKSFTAVFCSDDTMLIGVLEALGELELEVGKDVSIIGYGNLEISEKNAVSTVDIDLSELAEHCMTMLDENASFHYKRLTPKIIERSSVCRNVSKRVT